MIQVPKFSENKNFVGRKFEINKLREIASLPESSLIIVYGRRRVGKTELLEQTFRERNLLKLEGLEGQSAEKQRQHVLRQISVYFNDPWIALLNLESWVQVFELIAKYVAEGEWTVYFEETQWLACYEDAFASELKYVWDNYFRHNRQLKMILCGSSPSFMINKIIHSKALYSRSMHEMLVKPFSLREAQEFLPRKSQKELIDAYLTIGGIPEYLKRIKNSASLFIGICEHSFSQDSYFSSEYQKIFLSSLSNNKHYKKIIDLLSKHRFLTRSQILKHLKINSGGLVSEILEDLKICGFIALYVPYTQKANSVLARYCVQDRYLDFYFKFIAQEHENIIQGDYNEQPTHALNTARYQIWLGFAFERYCRENHGLIAGILGFSSVRYKQGVFFNRKTDAENPGFQIDLIFDRADNVLSICEIKYLQRKVGVEVIEEFETKLSLMPLTKKSIQKVLISVEGPSASLKEAGYFDRFITLDDIFSGFLSQERMTQISSS